MHKDGPCGQVKDVNLVSWLKSWVWNLRLSEMMRFVDVQDRSVEDRSVKWIPSVHNMQAFKLQQVGGGKKLACKVIYICWVLCHKTCR